MNNLSNEERKTLAGLARIEARRWSSLPDKQYMVDLMNIAITGLDQQGGWISCSERMPPDSKAVLTWDGVFEKIHHTMCGHWQCWQPGKITHWQFLPSPPPPRNSTNPQIDNGGWIEWGGGEMPVPENTEIDFICRDGEQGRNYEAREIGWFHDGAGDDIIAYRVIENDGREG